MAKESVRRHTTDITEGVSIESCFLAQSKLLEMTPQLACSWHAGGKTQGGAAGLGLGRCISQPLTSLLPRQL